MKRNIFFAFLVMTLLPISISSAQSFMLREPVQGGAIQQVQNYNDPGAVVQKANILNAEPVKTEVEIDLAKNSVEDNRKSLIASLQTYDQSDPNATTFEITFKFPSGTLEIAAPISFEVKAGRKVTIVGLQIKRGADFVGPSPLFTLSGEGRVILTDAKIDGVDKKNACLTVQTKGAVVSGGEYHNCTDGIRVEADGVRIADSNIHSNNLGVHVANTVESRFVVGAAGTRVEHTRVYGNDDGNEANASRLDGIRFDSLPLRNLQFYAKKDNGYVQKDADQGIFKYGEGEDVVIKLPEKPAASGVIEFYLATNVTELSQKYQAYGFTNAVMSVDANLFAQGGINKYVLTEGIRDKTLVAIYTDAALGSTVISEPFVTATGAISVPPISVIMAPSEPTPVPITGVTGPADGASGPADGGETVAVLGSGDGPADGIAGSGPRGGEVVAYKQDDEDEKAAGSAADGSGIGAAKMSCALAQGISRPRAAPIIIAAAAGILASLAFRKRFVNRKSD